ncbi:MAG: hypothetical protein MJY55_03325 [Bacteroidales bacterium]|nr:hypothetical protein [Bacteroidales bacterium]
MRVLVVFHVFYEHLAGYYLDRMRNISSCEWSLIVTGNHLSQGMIDSIRDLKSDAVFLECSNVGYDVWPFIAGIKTVNLDDYDLVIKLHTKNEDGMKFRLHGEVMTGEKWRSYMVDALMGSRDAFSALLAMFESDPNLGIAYSQKLNFKSNGGHLEDGSMLDAELKRLGITRRSSMFCAGTMFAVRASALKFLQRDDVCESVFEQSGPSHGSSTMAHVYERLIPICVVSSGYGIKLIPYSRCSAILFAFKDAVGPAVKWLVSVDYYGDSHSKYLKLFGMKIKL